MKVNDEGKMSDEIFLETFFSPLYAIEWNEKKHTISNIQPA